MTKLQSLLFAVLALSVLVIALWVCAAAKQNALEVCKLTDTEKACEQWLEGDGL